MDTAKPRKKGAREREGERWIKSPSPETGASRWNLCWSFHCGTLKVAFCLSPLCVFFFVFLWRRRRGTTSAEARWTWPRPAPATDAAIMRDRGREGRIIARCHRCRRRARFLVLEIVAMSNCVFTLNLLCLVCCVISAHPRIISDVAFMRSAEQAAIAAGNRPRTPRRTRKERQIFAFSVNSFCSRDKSAQEEAAADNAGLWNEKVFFYIGFVNGLNFKSLDSPYIFFQRPRWGVYHKFYFVFFITFTYIELDCCQRLFWTGKELVAGTGDLRPIIFARIRFRVSSAAGEELTKLIGARKRNFREKKFWLRQLSEFWGINWVWWDWKELRRVASGLKNSFPLNFVLKHQFRKLTCQHVPDFEIWIYSASKITEILKFLKQFEFELKFFNFCQFGWPKTSSCWHLKNPSSLQLLFFISNPHLACPAPIKPSKIINKSTVNWHRLSQ